MTQIVFETLNGPAMNGASLADSSLYNVQSSGLGFTKMATGVRHRFRGRGTILTDFDSIKQRDTFNEVISFELSYYETENDVNDSDNLTIPTSVAWAEKTAKYHGEVGVREAHAGYEHHTRVARTWRGLRTTK